ARRGEEPSKLRTDARRGAGDHRDGLVNRHRLSPTRSLCRTSARRIGRTCSTRLGGHALAQLDTRARRYAKQTRGAPDDVLLKLVNPPVDIDDLPHHLDHAPAPLLVERAVEQAGEVIEIDRLAIRQGRTVDELFGCRIVKSEPRAQD